MISIADCVGKENSVLSQPQSSQYSFQLQLVLRHLEWQTQCPRHIVVGGFTIRWNTASTRNKFNEIFKRSNSHHDVLV